MIALLGLGGAGAIGAALFFIPGLRAAITGIAQGIPPKVWAGIAGLAVIAAGFFYVRHEIHNAYDQGKRDGIAQEDAKWTGAFDTMEKAATQWGETFNSITAKVSAEERALHEQSILANASIADALRLRGPGASASSCVRPKPLASLSRGTGGRDATGGSIDATVAPVPPDGGLAEVPWPDLVEFGAQYDDNRDELIRWHEWYARERAAWDNARMEAPKFGKP